MEHIIFEYLSEVTEIGGKYIYIYLGLRAWQGSIHTLHHQHLQKLESFLGAHMCAVIPIIKCQIPHSFLQFCDAPIYCWLVLRHVWLHQCVVNIATSLLEYVGFKMLLKYKLYDKIYEWKIYG